MSRFQEAIQGGEIVLETTPLRRGMGHVAQDAAMAVEQLFEGEQTAEFHEISADPVCRVTIASRIKEQ